MDKARERMEQSPAKAYNVLGTLAHNPMVAEQIGRFSIKMLFKTAAERRQIELVVLRMGWNCRSIYEFGQHTLFGLDAGLTEAEIYAVTRPLVTHEWSETDRILLQMVDDLHGDDCVSDATWAELSAHWPVSDVMEFMGAALIYRVVSSMLNSCGVELDDGVPGWPTAP